MKYIKLFEQHLNIPDDEQDLVELFSQKFIENFFLDNYQISAEEASHAVNLWDYVNIDKFRDNLIKDTAENKEIDDKEFSNEDYIDFIKEKKLKSGWNEEILKKVSRNQLIDLIEDNNEEYNFILKYFTDKWEDTHPKDILIELHGKDLVEENLYNYLFYYVNDNDIIDDYINNKVQFETKMEYVRDYICCDIGLQRKLLKINKNTVEALFNVMDSNDTEYFDGSTKYTIGHEYKFQKLYIITKIKNNSGSEIIEQAMKELNDKFILNPKIEEEYAEYMYLINAEKYNL